MATIKLSGVCELGQRIIIQTPSEIKIKEVTDIPAGIYECVNYNCPCRYVCSCTIHFNLNKLKKQ